MYRALLQKRPIIWSILPTVATPCAYLEHTFRLYIYILYIYTCVCIFKKMYIMYLHILLRVAWAYKSIYTYRFAESIHNSITFFPKKMFLQDTHIYICIFLRIYRSIYAFHESIYVYVCVHSQTKCAWDMCVFSCAYSILGILSTSIYILHIYAYVYSRLYVCIFSVFCSEECFFYYPWRNNVVVLFGTLKVHDIFSCVYVQHTFHMYIYVKYVRTYVYSHSMCIAYSLMCMLSIRFTCIYMLNMCVHMFIPILCVLYILLRVC